MSDIKKGRSARGLPSPRAEKALVWIERYIRRRGLGVGDALPGEMDLAGAAGVGRSSVREALTALKALGVIRSRRKGGIHISRDPVLLELRHYFTSRLPTTALHTDTMEFRAALEWGLSPLILDRVTPKTIHTLHRIMQSVAEAAPGWTEIGDAEIRFHTTLTAACGNRLATLFAHLYGPLFKVPRKARPMAGDVQKWLQAHEPMVDALESRDAAAFLAALRAHTHSYMRLRRGTDRTEPTTVGGGGQCQ